MPFELLDIRPLTREEREAEAEAKALLGAAYRRRDFLGTISAATVASFLTFGIDIGRAKASNFLLAGIRRLTAADTQRTKPVRAQMDLVNSTGQSQSAGVALEVQNPEGIREQQDTARVSVPAESVITLRHSGFTGKSNGQNTYHAETAEEQENDDFRVFD